MSTAITRLTELVKHDLAKTNHLIVNHMQSNVPLIPELAGYLVASGGKRVRPVLTLATAKLCEYEGNHHCELAAAVEFIHTATLLHDDVVDESDERRGQQTANLIYGNQPSVLVGDFLFSRAFQMMVASGSLKVLEILSNASARIAEGEVKQITLQHDLNAKVEDYIDVITAKTAILFAAACEVSAALAGKEELQSLLFGYGLNLGIAFQMKDDVLDYDIENEKMGKKAGDDFKEGKITLPVLLAYEKADEQERSFWQRTLGEGNFKDGDFTHACTLLEKHDSLQKTESEAKTYAQKAKNALSFFADGDVKTALLDLVDFCITRDK